MGFDHSLAKHGSFKRMIANKKREWIRSLREQHGLTQSDCNGILYNGRDGRVKGMEQGSVTITLSDLLRYERVFNEPIEELLFDIKQEVFSNES
jgi:transcriptional regulator with XRE-family HTH domain